MSFEISSVKLDTIYCIVLMSIIVVDVNCLVN